MPEFKNLTEKMFIHVEFNPRPKGDVETSINSNIGNVFGYVNTLHAILTIAERRTQVRAVDILALLMKQMEKATTTQFDHSVLEAIMPRPVVQNEEEST
jgi:hypothetical protein